MTMQQCEGTSNGVGIVAPAIGQLASNVFQIGISHVVDAKDVNVGVFRNGVLHGSVQLQGQFFAFLLGFG